MKDYKTIFENFESKESSTAKNFNESTKAEKIAHFGKFGYIIEGEKKYKFSAVAKREDFESDSAYIKFVAKVATEKMHRIFTDGEIKKNTFITYNAYKRGEQLTQDEKIAELSKQATKDGKYNEIINTPILVDVLGGENWRDFCRWIVANADELLK